VLLFGVFALLFDSLAFCLLQARISGFGFLRRLFVVFGLTAVLVEIQLIFLGVVQALWVFQCLLDEGVHALVVC
jgi:hypothetical protein